MASTRKFEIECPECLTKRVIPYHQFWLIKKDRTTTKCFKCSRMKKGETNSGSLKKGHPISFENRKKIRIAMLGRKCPWIKSGPENPNWISDRNKLKSNGRGNYKRRDWAKRIKKRDGYVCRIADINCNGRLEAHHILPWSKFLELRYQLNNGITLCQFHHPLVAEEVKRLSPYFQELVSETKD